MQLVYAHVSSVFLFFYFFLSLGSFMAAKTEPVVLMAKVGHTELWNLLCNLASRSLKKIFCFPPFLHVYPQLKEKREL